MKIGIVGPCDRVVRDLTAATTRVAELEAQASRLRFYLVEQLWDQWEVAGRRGKMTDEQMIRWSYEGREDDPGYEHVLSDLGEGNN